MDFAAKILELNEKIKNPREVFEAKKGYEMVLEALIYNIYSVFGKNALLSTTYQIGAGPGQEIAQKILDEKSVSKIKDPLDAFEALLNENREFYSVEILDIKQEPHDEKYNKLVLTIHDRCFYREVCHQRKRLRVGGPLCRINKAYFETALKKLTGFKVEIAFIKDIPEKDMCLESITFFLPK
jgi:hypothetical protein